MIRQANFKSMVDVVRLANNNYRLPIKRILSSNSTKSVIQRSSLSTSECMNLGSANTHLANGVVVAEAKSPASTRWTEVSGCVLFSSWVIGYSWGEKTEMIGKKRE